MKCSKTIKKTTLCNLGVYIGGLLFFIVVMVGVLSFQNALQQEKEILGKSTEYLSLKLAEKINKSKHLAEITGKSLETLTSQMSQNDLINFLNQDLAKKLNLNPDYSGFWVTFEPEVLTNDANEGSYWAYWEEKQVKLFDASTASEAESDLDDKEKEYYQTPRNTLKSYLSKPYLDEILKQVMVSMTTPLLIDNNFKGVVGVDIGLNYLTEELKSYKYKNSYSFILDEDGTIISHPNPDLLMKNIKTLFPDFEITKIKNAEKFSMQKISSQTNQNSIYTFSPLSFSQDLTNWSICMVLPLSDLYQEPIKYSFIFLILAILAVGLIIFIMEKSLEKRIFKPIKSISDLALDLASGDGDLTKRLPESENELGILSQNFNQFIGNIQGVISETMQITNESGNSAQNAIENSKIVTKSSVEQNQQIQKLTNNIQNISISIHNVLQNSTSIAKFNQSNFQKIQNFIKQLSHLI
ncbi:MAG TPA: methyl-accepting chemotaxis protein, partial [Candidatus Gracilibacteria bacterium]|nr:methyl-accepting chemotaxis protein [Candidatus Gracilibacteria bacterium]